MKVIMQKFQNIKEYFIGILVILAIAVYGFHYFTTTINERGFLGMDKSGRQIFLQTMDHYASTIDNSVFVTSDWDDFSFTERLWQNPMRTTLRIYKTMNEDDYLKFQIAEGLAQISPSQEIEESLKVPYKEFLHNYSSEISMSDDYSVTPEELEEFADEAGVLTYRDLLRGFGFTKYEYYVNGKLKSSIILNPKITNHIEGNFISTIGSTKNEVPEN